MDYEHREVASEEGTSHTIDDSTFDTNNFFREHLSRASDGKLEIVGDDLSPVELALLDTEKRRRGSQSAVTREKTRADKFELELGKVKEIIPTVERAQPVNQGLKYSDPDEYIRLSLEASKNNPYDDAFNTAEKYAQQTVGAQTVQSVLAEHNQANPQRQLTEEMLNLDLPPRLLGDLESGKITPHDFLAQAADTLYRHREVANQEIPVTPNLGKVGGSTTPTSDGSNEAQHAQYASAVF